MNRLALAGAIVGIVSGALRHEIELGLRILGAQDSVRFIVSAEDTRACKPDPEGYLVGRNRLIAAAGNQAASRVLVVEDSLAGITAARAADMPCLGVSHSYEKSELLRAGAVQVVSHLAEIDDSMLAALSARIYG